MKKHGGLGAYLNQDTREVKQSAENVINYIDIDEIIPNPQNFYGLRDIDSLAGLISVSGHIEPLEVKQLENGKYMLIAGHRRRAAVLKLLNDGEIVDRKLPCIVRTFKDNGCLTATEVEKCSLIFSNKGQRKERTMEEQLEEIKQLEPIARKIFAEEKAKGNIDGNFRRFFAEEILGISSSALQRKLALEKLTPKAKEAVNCGKISETAASELVSMPASEQDKYIDSLKIGSTSGTVKDVQDVKKKNDLLADTEDEDLADKNEPSLKDLEKDGQQKFENMSDPDEIPDGKGTLEAPEKEARKWLAQFMLPLYQQALSNAMTMEKKAADKGDEHSSAQWNVRISVTKLKIVEIKEHLE